MSLQIEKLTRRIHTRTMLERIDLEAQSGEILGLLGPQGSGRATLLRVIAGLDPADSGTVRLDGQDITHLPPRRRPIGHVFQHDPLFGHPTVFEAVAAAMPEGPPGAAPAGEIDALLDLVGLGGRGAAMPATLPADKRHRLALARSLAARPRVLLVGEAFGPQGSAGRKPSRGWMRELLQRFGVTAIVVVQDLAEAAVLADRVAVLREGKVEQVATPTTLRRWPATPFVAEFLGVGTTLAAPAMAALQMGPGAFGAVRPESLEVVDPSAGTPAKVVASTAFGARLRVELQLLADGSRVEAEVPSMGLATALPPGTVVGLRVRPDTNHGWRA